MALRIVASRPDPAIITLPWSVPLEEWGEPHLVPLPRGLSRHVVRMVRLGDRIYAVKETVEDIAFREYRLLRDLQRLNLPAVVAQGVVTGRVDADGRGAAERAAHRAPALLAALPEPVQPRPVPRQPAVAGRRDGGAPGPAAPRGLLLGRRVALQRAVPAQRRRLRGLPRRRGDRRAAAQPVHVDAGVRRHDRDRERLRRAARPAGQRVAERRGRGARDRRAARDPLPGAVGGADRRGGVLRRRRCGGSSSASSGSTTSASTSTSSTSSPTSTATGSASSRRSSRPATTSASCRG